MAKTKAICPLDKEQDCEEGLNVKGEEIDIEKFPPETHEDEYRI